MSTFVVVICAACLLHRDSCIECVCILSDPHQAVQSSFTQFTVIVFITVWRCAYGASPGAPMHRVATDCLLIVKAKMPTKQPHGYASFSNCTCHFHSSLKPVVE